MCLALSMIGRSQHRYIAMGTRKMRERQEDLWYGGSHPFYQRLNEVLDSADYWNASPKVGSSKARPSGWIRPLWKPTRR